MTLNADDLDLPVVAVVLGVMLEIVVLIPALEAFLTAPATVTWPEISKKTDKNERFQYST